MKPCSGPLKVIPRQLTLLCAILKLQNNFYCYLEVKNMPCHLSLRMSSDHPCQQADVSLVREVRWKQSVLTQTTDTLDRLTVTEICHNKRSLGKKLRLTCHFLCSNMSYLLFCILDSLHFNLQIPNFTPIFVSLFTFLFLTDGPVGLVLLFPPLALPLNSSAFSCFACVLTHRDPGLK